MIKMIFLLVSALVVFAAEGKAQEPFVDDTLPPDINECLQSLPEVLTSPTGNVSTLSLTEEELFTECLQRFVWKSEAIDWTAHNITDKDMGFINSLIKSIIRPTRVKRQIGPVGVRYPQTGFRIRREYRRLPDGERMALHAALNIMKNSGQYDTFANLHSGMVTTSAHFGPNFFGWHRVYLALFEESLRRINPILSIPYWDSTLDFDMDDPVESIIWSPGFLGNGDGTVTVGPFANWMTPDPLTRNTGGGSRLLSKEVIRVILSRCRTSEISDPTADLQYNLEIAHGGPHVWVGGQMSGLNTAAHDPVFFMHHAFIDYIWEVFRIRQARFCGVNPATDYPPAVGEHAPNNPMIGFNGFRNIDGYANYWTQFWYKYERSPTCGWFRPFCGSPYLRCDMSRQRCVSIRRPAPAPSVAARGAMVAGFAAASPANRMASVARGRAQEAAINIGPRFRAPPPEPRTQDGMRMAGRKKRSTHQRQRRQAFGQTFRAPPSDGRSRDSRKNANAFISSNPMSDFKATSFFSPMSMLPSVDFTAFSRSSQTPKSNQNAQGNLKGWVFIPVEINYNAPTEEHVFRTSSGQTEVALGSASSFVSTASCQNDMSDLVEIKVMSDGLSYVGSFFDFVFLDPRSTSPMTVKMGVKSPDASPSKVILSAFDGCGRMCQSLCAVPGSMPISYKPCRGIISVTSREPLEYHVVLPVGASNVTETGQNTNIVFNCGRDLPVTLDPSFVQ